VTKIAEPEMCDERSVYSRLEMLD